MFTYHSYKSVVITGNVSLEVAAEGRSGVSETLSSYRDVDLSKANRSR